MVEDALIKRVALVSPFLFHLLFVVLCHSGNKKEVTLVDNFNKAIEGMNEEIEVRTSAVGTVFDIEEKTYRVEVTGATITSTSSISLLYDYCSELPHDEYGFIQY